MLVLKGKIVIFVDIDLQCNLIGVSLGEGIEDDEKRIEIIYNIGLNIKIGLVLVFEV